MTSKLLTVCLVLASTSAPTLAASVQGCNANDTTAPNRIATGKPRDGLTAAIVACTRIATPAKRLDCYDALTGHSD